MHDPKFEKEVQQKMEELVFTPPASVWLNVEKEVNKEKKRRFLPFWFFFLPVTLLIGAGAIYFSGSKQSKNVGQPVPATNTVTTSPDLHQEPSRPDVSAQPGVHPSANVRPPIKIQPDRDNSLTVSGQASDPRSPAGRVITAAEPASQPSHQGQSSVSPAIAGNLPRHGAGGTHAGPSHAAAGTPRGRYSAADGIAAASQRSKPDENNDITGKDPQSTGTSHPGQDNPGSGSIPRPFVHRSVNPQRSPIERHAASIAASALPFPEKKSGKILLPTPARPWTAGFAAGVGISSLNQGLLDKSSVTSAAYTNYASAVTGVPQTYVSNTQPDLSFWAGVLLQKNLRKDLSLSLGLNLHYYSSKIKTGKMVNSDVNGLQNSPSPPSSANSFVLGNTVLAASGRAYPYYSPGNNETYTNRYYFLELPASISWQVGHIKSMPLFWEGGMSLSYLVSSNSLYYNPKSGVFYKDGSGIPRTQANIFTGFMVGLPFHGLRIQAGPQVQYGFTNLLNSQGAGSQHLLYGGIKLVFLPGKWKK